MGHPCRTVGRPARAVNDGLGSRRGAQAVKRSRAFRSRSRPIPGFSESTTQPSSRRSGSVKRGASRRRGGRIALELKTALRDGTRKLVFEPLEFLERLAAMTPPAGPPAGPPTVWRRRCVWHSMPLTWAGSLDPRGDRSYALCRLFLGRPVSEYGILCHGGGAQGRATGAGGRSC